MSGPERLKASCFEWDRLDGESAKCPVEEKRDDDTVTSTSCHRFLPLSTQARVIFRVFLRDYSVLTSTSTVLHV